MASRKRNAGSADGGSRINYYCRRRVKRSSPSAAATTCICCGRLLCTRALNYVTIILYSIHSLPSPPSHALLAISSSRIRHGNPHDAASELYYARTDASTIKSIDLYPASHPSACPSEKYTLANKSNSQQYYYSSAGTDSPGAAVYGHRGQSRRRKGMLIVMACHEVHDDCPEPVTYTAMPQL